MVITIPSNKFCMYFTINLFIKLQRKDNIFGSSIIKCVLNVMYLKPQI